MSYQSHFFGRKKGRALSQNQTNLVASGLKHYGINVLLPSPEHIGQLFDIQVSDVHLEIGFGGGEHLLHSVLHHLQKGFIGVEPFVNGMAKLLLALAGSTAHNLRLYNRDACEILDWLPESSLSGIDLFYPDPWLKRRHRKRRFVNPKNLKRMTRVLKRGGLFRFVSDIPDYADWTLLHCQNSSVFKYIANDSEEWKQIFQAWVKTRYELKALQASRNPFYLAFERQ